MQSHEESVGFARTCVLMVIEDDIATTELVEQLLQACSRFGLSYRKQYLRALSISDLNSETIPLFVRTGDPGSDYWAHLLRESNWPYLYYIDDNFWEIGGESALALYYQDPGVRRSLTGFVSNAARVLTNSDVLALYLRRFSCRVHCVPPFFDFSLINVVADHVPNEIRIGFAGSSSRADDLELIRPAISTVLSRFPNAVFEFAGVMPFGVEVQERVRFFPAFPSYTEFARFQASRGWRIGLAPLLAKDSNRSKTNNKFREYGACGIAGIYSALEPYAEVVSDITGRVVPESSSAWTEAICDLLEKPELVDNIARAARATVRERYSVDVIAVQWMGQFAALAPKPGEQARRVSRRARCKLWCFKAIGVMRSVRLAMVLAHRQGGYRLLVGKTWSRLRRFGARAR